MSMYEASEIIDEATREMPEELLDNPEVTKVLDTLWKTFEVMTDWIDPNSNHYMEDIYSAKRDGAQAMREEYKKLMEDALYRQELFEEKFDLRAFIRRLSDVDIDEVMLLA